MLDFFKPLACNLPDQKARQYIHAHVLMMEKEALE